MPMLSPEDLKSVVTEGHGPAVSIFLPTHRAGPDIQQDSIRLKNLLKQAESELVREGNQATRARELLAPVSDLLDDAAFWRHQQDGLAIFRSPDVFRVYRLPVVLEEQVAVSDRFHVKPLLPLLIDDARFYILALSQKAVRLLDCTRDDIRRVELPDVPQGMADALPENTSPQLQRHTLPMEGKNAARFHGHGVGTDDVDVTNLTRYFHRIDDGLRQVLRDEAPLILACVEYLAPIFKEVSGYRPILDEIVAGNPDGVKDSELHKQGRVIAEQQFRQVREKAAAEYHEGIVKGRAGHALADVLPAAFQGRIATLFVPTGIRRWGRFVFDTLTLEEHEAEQPGDEELLDLAAVQTLLHGGRLYSVPPEEIPGRQLLAAVYRF